jgi:superfamily II DNA or RNA helicase
VNLPKKTQAKKIHLLTARFASIRFRPPQSELAELETQSADDQGDNHLTVILRARQRIELLRVPTIVELAEDEIEQGRSVVIFCSFDATIDALCEKLKTTCVVRGGQSDRQREENIQAFQRDEQRIIIVNIAAGGVGISLHDLNGRFPRTSLICPTWRIDELIQAIGRIWRAGARSKAIQRFLFAAGTIEERMAEAVVAKGGNLNLLNGDDVAAGLDFLRKHINASPSKPAQASLF